MLTLFATTKKHEIDSKSALYNQKFLLPPFSVIVAEQGANVQINKADSNSISIEYIKNDKARQNYTPLKMIHFIFMTGLKCLLSLKNKYCHWTKCTLGRNSPLYH